MKSVIAAIAAIALVATDDARATGAPADGARAFYAVYGTFHPSDGIPDGKALARYAPTISPSLERLFVQAGQAGAKFANANKDSPPLIEGDLMTSNFEGATSSTVGDCAIKGRLATCKIDLVNDPGAEGEKPARWSDSLVLVDTDQGWRVDDVVYGATWAFGNKGRLSETLRHAITDAGS
jgi:hypothetical protein